MFGIMALGIGLICSAKVVFFHIGAISIIAKEPQYAKKNLKVTSPFNATQLPCEQNLSKPMYLNN
jgi:hypothetical protein